MGKRREKGTGSVYPDSDRPGRFIGELTIEGKRRRVSGPTRTDVRAKLRALAAKRDRGELIGDRRLTVAELVDLFLERELPNRRRNGRPLAPRTVEMYEWAAEVLRAELGTTRVARLTVADVEAMYDRLASREVRPLGVASLRQLSSKFALIITFGERRDLVPRNVVRLAHVTPTATQPKRRRVLLPDDARLLLAALREPYTNVDATERRERNGAMFGLSLRLGLRPGEAAGLYWTDLVLDGDCPTVNVTRGRRDDRRGHVEISDDLKTSTSKRTLALPPDLAAWLREHHASQRLERMAATAWADDQLVFATSAGTPVEASNGRRQLAAVCRRAGVPIVRPNELRHSCASLLSDEGVANEAIADLLGHTTTRMVDVTYRHRLRPVVDVAVRSTWATGT